MTAAADRHLLFGLLALQNGLIDQGQLVAAFQAWTRDKSRSLADHLDARGDLTAATRRCARRAGRGSPGGARRRRREEPGRRPRRPVHPREPGRPRRPRHRGDARPRGSSKNGQATEADDDNDPDRTATLSVGAVHQRRPAVPRPPAPRPGRPGRRLRGPGRRAAPRGGAQADPRPPRRRPGQPPAVPPRGRDHRRAGAPRHRPGLRPGHLRRRPALLRHAVHQGRQPQGGHRALPRRSSSLEGSDPGRRSLELRKLLRRFTDVCNAIDYAHSRGVLHRDIKPGNIIVGKHGETLVVDWGLAKAVGRAEPSVGERTLVPSSASGQRRRCPAARWARRPT